MRVILRSVQRMLSDGIPFEHVEAFIDSSKLADEEKALLLIYAWVGADPCTIAADLGLGSPSS